MNRYILAIILIVLIGFYGERFTEGQTLDTGGWQQTQCGPRGCGPSSRGIGIGIGIGTWQQPPLRQQPRQNAPKVPPLAYQVTVRIEAAEGGGATSCGSGVIIGPDLVLTASHVLRDCRGVIRVCGVAATKIADSPVWDVALLRTSQRWSQYTALANYRPQIGGGVFSGGYAHAGPIHWFYGRVTKYITHQTGAPLDWIEAESGITSGDSGGPILDGNGHVVGILWGSDGRGHLSGVVCTRIWQEFGQWLQSSSAPAGQNPPVAIADPDGAVAGTGGNAGAGANADSAQQWAAKIEAIRAEWRAEFEAWKATQAAADATLNATVEAKAEAAVNVHVQQYTGELDAFGKRMVAMDGRVKKLEGEMVAVQEQLKQPPTFKPIDMDKFVQDVADRMPTTYTPTDYGQLADEVIKRLPKREVHFLDNQGNVASKQVVGPTDPITIPPQWLRTLDKDGNAYKDTTAPLGWPLQLKSEFVHNQKGKTNAR